MDLEPTAEQLELVDELRRALAGGVSWDALVEMGVLALPVPETDGGVGLGWAEAALAFQALGHACVAGPFVTTAAATAVGLADGATGVVPSARRVFVEHLDALDSLLVVGDSSVRRVALPLVGARPVARPTDPGTPVHLVDGPLEGDEAGDASCARRLTRHAALLAAAMHVGIGNLAIERATTYAHERHQFGRPIGSFQAVKHVIADAAVAVEVARAAVDAAAVMEDEHTHDVDRGVAAARVVAADAAARASQACIQVHGGMGYTWELGVHLYLKRALALDHVPLAVERAIDVMASVSS